MKMLLKNMNLNTFAGCSLLLISVFTLGLSAQDLSKEVYVVSSYRPEIADVDKISSMPVMTDTFSFDTKIEYTVLPSRIKSDYSLRPIKPAKMVGTPLDKLYNSYLKVGLGNYASPLAEYSIHNLRSKEYAVGAYIFHRSSHFKFEPRTDTKIPAGYGRTELAGYGKKFYRNVNLEAEIGANRHRIRHYGLNTDLLSDPFEIEADEIKQAYNKVYALAGVRSTRPDSGKMAFKVFIAGDYFRDHFKNKEPHVNISADVNIPVKSFFLRLEGDYDYYNFKNSYDTAATNLYNFHPVLTKRKEEWSIEAGARMTVLRSAEKDSFYIYPDANIKFRVIENALLATIGVSGNLQVNSYENLSLENPYIIPGSIPSNTNHALIFYAGVEGYLSRKASYKIMVSWESMQDMVFFVNSDTNDYQNQFDYILNDADRINYHLEFCWDPFHFLGFRMNTNYHTYQMYGEDHPWQRPKADLELSVLGNFKQKLYAELDFIAVGKRYAYNINGINAIVLDPIYDLNLKLEYKYSNILSFFAHFYNLTNQEHYYWNQYRSQGINILAGLGYKF